MATNSMTFLRRFSRPCRYTFVIVLLLLVFPQAGAGASQDTEKPVIVVLGDSLSAAYNIPVSRGWVALLGAKLREEGYAHEVINESISGDTTGGGLARLPAILERNRNKVSLLILELGGNDGLRGYPLDVMKENLVNIIRLAGRADARVLLAGITIPNNYGPRYRRQFEDVYQQIATEEKTALLPNLLENVPLTDAYFLEDRLHPAVVAQPIIADTVWLALAQML